MHQKQLLNIAWLILFAVSIQASERQLIPKSNVTNMVSIVANTCSISSLDMCLSIFKEVTTDSDLAFPVTKDSLNTACKKLKEGDTCADNHMKNCTNKNQKMLFQDIVKGTKKVLELLCVPGEFQNNYLRFAKCFKNVSISEQKCAPIMKKVQTMNLDVPTQMEEQLKKFCCTMKESVDCQIDFVQRDCGTTAVQFFEKYLKEISSQLMVDHCATYTYSDSCNPRIDSLSNSSSIKKQIKHYFKLFIIWIYILFFN